MKVTIQLDEKEVKILTKRAKKNLLTLREMVEDIIRRSCISCLNEPVSEEKIDDRLVGIFSRQKRGGKRR